MSRKNARKNKSGLAERQKFGASTTTTIYYIVYYIDIIFA